MIIVIFFLYYIEDNYYQMKQQKKIFSGIYQYSFKENGKRYIGSSINLFNRNKSHLSALDLNSHINKDFQQAFNKYGLVNLQYSILEYIDNSNFLNGKITKKLFQEELFKVEQKYLDNNYAQEYIQNSKDLRFFENLYNKSVLAKYTYSQKCIKNEVHKYNLKGDYIESFLNSSIAGICCNIDSSSIRRVCNGQRSSCGNFLWSYEKMPNIKKYQNKVTKCINQYDKNKNLIHKYNSIKEAKIATNIDIRKERKSKCIVQGGYYWLFDGESFPLYKNSIKNYGDLSIKIKDFKKLKKKYGELKFFRECCIKEFNISSSIFNNYYYKN